MASCDGDNTGGGRRRRLMTAPMNARAWNDELISAMEVRMHSYRARNMRKWFAYRDAAALLRTVRDDIWRGATGQRRFRNLPPGLPDSIRAECENVMRGELDVIPRDMEVHQPGREGFVPEGQEEHPYLNRMRPYEGGYAILMAFQSAGKDRMTKREILARSRKHAQVEMEANFHAGRLRAGWDSIKSLERHGLVVRRGGLNSRMAGTCDEFVLTAEGARFIPKMMRKFGAAPGAGGGVVSAGACLASGGARQSLSPSAAVAPSLSGNAAQQRKQADAEDTLLSWVTDRERAPGDALPLEAPKHVRKHLHQVCDHLRTKGYSLDHASAGDGRARMLMITFQGRSDMRSSAKGRLDSSDSGDESRGTRKRPRPVEWSEKLPWEEPLVSSAEFAPTPPSSGRRLLGGSAARMPRDAAAAAAMRRLEASGRGVKDDDDTALALALSESSRAQRQRLTHCGFGDEDDPALAAALAESRAMTDSSRTLPAGRSSFIDGEDDVDLALALSASAASSDRRAGNGSPPSAARTLDFDLDGEIQNGRKKVSYGGGLEWAVVQSLSENQSPVASSHPAFSSPTISSKPASPGAVAVSTVYQRKSVVVHVDSREKRRNDDPRGVMNKVKEKVAAKGPGWPRALAATVDQMGLATGDFCFEVCIENGDSGGGGRAEDGRHVTGDTLVERKTLSDLAGRLGRRHGNAHYNQCRRMLSSGVPLPCILVEGDPSAALRAGEQGYAVYDANEAAGEEGVLDLFGEMARILLHFEGRVRVLLSPGLAESADLIRSLAILAEPLSPHMLFDDFMATKGSTARGGAYVSAQRELIDALAGLRGIDAVTRRFVSLSELRRAYESCGRNEEAMLHLLEPLGLSAEDSRRVWMSVCGSVHDDCGRSFSSSQCLASITVESARWCDELSDFLQAKRINAVAKCSSKSANSRSSSGSCKLRASRKSVEEACIFVYKALPGERCSIHLQSLTFRLLAVDASKIAEVVFANFDPDADDIRNAVVSATTFVSLLPPPKGPVNNSSHKSCGEPIFKDILFVERLGSQVTALNMRCSKDGNHNSRLLLERAHSIMHLVVGLLYRSPRFFTISTRLLSHTNEFVTSLCAVMLLEALLPHLVENSNASFSSPRQNSPPPTRKAHRRGNVGSSLSSSARQPSLFPRDVVVLDGADVPVEGRVIAVRNKEGRKSFGVASESDSGDESVDLTESQDATTNKRATLGNDQNGDGCVIDLT